MYPATFPTLRQYDLDLWPPNLKNNRHIPLIMVINCIKLYDPGGCGSFCILPTTFSYYVTIRPWPLTLENNRHIPLIMLIKCTSCKILELKATRPEQTDGQWDGRTYGRRHTIIRPVKNGRIKSSRKKIDTIFLEGSEDLADQLTESKHLIMACRKENYLGQL